MCFIKDTLVNNFPTYKVNDASDRTKEEMEIIITLCHKIPNLIVFMKRNGKNDEYFEEYDKNFNLERGIKILFYNKDDFIYFERDDDNEIEGAVRFLRRFINGENVCVICYEQFDGTKRNLLSCTKCGEGCCIKCINNMLKTELDKFEKVDILCPVCRSSSMVRT